jgi:hypothetical protein
MKNNTRYEVLTPDGWCDFKGVKQNGLMRLLQINLTDGRQVSATPNHIFFQKGKHVRADNLRRGDRIDTLTGSAEIENIKNAGNNIVYDLVEVANPQHAFSINNGILSKNCDEFAFVQPNKQKDFWTSIQPTLAEGGSCIITSTPKNDEDIFAQLWKGAEDNIDENGNVTLTGVGKNGFFAVKVPWWEHPDRDEAWARPFRESLGEARFRQEFECEFVTDDETLINPLTLSRLTTIAPIGYTGTVRWYCDPEPNHAFLVALDPAMGTERNYGAIEVFQMPEMVQVAEWQHNGLAARHQVRVMMEILYEIDGILRADPRQTNTPEIFWTFENNSLGEGVLTIVEDTGEERFPGNLITERRRKGIAMKRVRRGLHTNTRNKMSACARLKSLIESDRMVINSNNLLRELKNFVAIGNSFAAKPGENDDLVSATLMIVRMLDIALAWGSNPGDLREYISDQEIGDEIQPMPVVI